MARMGGWSLVVCWSLLALAGCSSQPCSCWCCRPQATPCLERQVLPISGRGEFKADQDGPSFPVAAAETLGRPKDWPPYHCLGARDCQCQAAQASYQANLLDLEQQATLQQAANAKKMRARGSDRVAELRSMIFHYMGLEDRNRSSARALDYYYRLGEAEANWDLLRESLGYVDSALTKTRDLKRQGLALPVEEGTLYRQQVDVQSQSVQLELNIRQLNSDLRVSLAFCPCGPEWRFWPCDAFDVNPEPVCLEDAVHVGLSHRPELVLLNRLEHELNSGDLATVQKLLSALSALLGAAQPPPPCPKLMAILARLCDTDSAEMDIRRRQLAEYHAHREREVIEEITRAVQTIKAQMEVVTLVRKRAESWQAKVREAEERESKGVGSYAETADARGDWMRARRRVVEETTNLQRARVQLRQAQGILPEECCHLPPLPARIEAPSEVAPPPRPTTTQPRGPKQLPPLVEARDSELRTLKATFGR